MGEPRPLGKGHSQSVPPGNRLNSMQQSKRSFPGHTMAAPMTLIDSNNPLNSTEVPSFIASSDTSSGQPLQKYAATEYAGRSEQAEGMHQRSPSVTISAVQNSAAIPLASALPQAPFTLERGPQEYFFQGQGILPTHRSTGLHATI